MSALYIGGCIKDVDNKGNKEIFFSLFFSIYKASAAAAEEEDKKGDENSVINSRFSSPNMGPRA